MRRSMVAVALLLSLVTAPSRARGDTVVPLTRPAWTLPTPAAATSSADSDSHGEVDAAVSAVVGSYPLNLSDPTPGLAAIDPTGCAQASAGRLAPAPSITQTVRLIPRLQLMGFSQIGCPVANGMGAVLARGFAISKRFSLVASVGAFVMPQNGLLGANPVRSDARLDLVFRPGDGSMRLRVGIGAGSRSTLMFGGTW